MPLDDSWRTLVRQLAEPYAAQLVELVGTARRAGWTDDQIEEELKRFQAMVRESFAPAFTPALIELLIAEMMGSYLKQADPPSKAIQ